MIAFKESPLVLTNGAIESLGDYASYAGVAKRFDLPIQLEVRSPETVALVREVAASSGARIIIAGIVEPSTNGDDPSERAAALASAAVDLLYAARFPSIDELDRVARAMAETKTPFALAPMLSAEGTMTDGTTLADAIARLDDDPTARPWHYMLACLHVAQAATALESLFRTAPGLAHRVVGLQANGSPEAATFARDVWECAQTFGLHVLGGCAGTDARDIEAIAQLYRAAGES